jgi:hypothetical protein
MEGVIITPDVLEGIEDELAGALLGAMDYENQNALLLGIGEIGRANPARGRKLVSKLNRAMGVKAGAVKAAAPGYPNSRVELLNRLALLPETYRKGLAEKRLRTMDGAYFQAKSANAASGIIQIFQTGDVKGYTAANLGNVAGAKLDADKPFLVTAIQLLSGVAAGNLAGTAFLASTLDNAIKNGNFTIRHDGKEIVKEMSCTVFDTTNRNDRQQGTYILDNPFWLMPQTEFSLDIQLAGSTAANTNIKATLFGSGVIPA